MTPSPDEPPEGGPHATLRIGEWTVLALADRIERAGSSHKLEPRAMRLLLVLARAGGAVVPASSLLATVWAGVVVTPSSLYESVSRLRKLLGRDAEGREAIESVPRKGYRLRWPVHHTAAPPLDAHSIAVLPFEAIGVEPAFDFIPPALTDRLIGELSRHGELSVLARGTMLRYGERSRPAAELARELGVRCVVDARVRQGLGERLWVEVALVDGPSQRQTWTETIELPVRHWMQAADIVAGRLARSLTFEFHARAPRADPGALPQHESARDLAARAWVELFARPESQGTNQRAQAWARQALGSDPGCGLAEVCLATCAWRAAQFGWESPPGAALDESTLHAAMAHAERALELAPDEPDAHYVLGLIAYSRGETVRAEEALRHCLRLSGSFAPAFGLLALVRTRLGHPDEAPALCDRAFALSPREPLRAVWHLALGWSALARHDAAAALDAAQRAMAVNPAFPTPYAVGAVAARMLGQEALAAQWVEVLRARSPFRSVAEFLRRMPAATAPAHRRQMQTAARWLAEAGLPKD
ncbi:winged helix-turn-helix domain-containing protein [Xenophilus aerolatus]|nr:winged helix-turn-helix domain-containing protein [Xenophilus aerolatus]